VRRGKSEFAVVVTVLAETAAARDTTTEEAR
jgi:hypothetical protein